MWPNISSHTVSSFLHRIQCLCQERANRECLAHVEHRIAKTSRSMRLTDLDLTNNPMRRVSKQLEDFCADMLLAIAKHTCGVESKYADFSTPNLVLKCAHDSIADPSTGEIISPHFVVDCTNLCKYIADLAVKTKFGDAGPLLYEVLASNAVKTAKKCEKAITKANKAVAKATKKAEQAAAKAAKSGAKTNKAVEATAKSLEKAKAKRTQAQAAADTAATAVTEAAAKAAQTRTLAHSIVQSWRAEFDNVTACTSTATALVKPTCLEICQVYVPPCSKCKGSQCNCT